MFDKVLKMSGFWICQSYAVLQVCLNMSEKYLNMPKYTLICHNKKCSIYFGILSMPDAVAYCIYPSIFRHLQCSEPEAYSEPSQNLWLSVSFKIPCNPSIHRPLEYSEHEPFSEPWFFYSEACGWYTKDRLIKIIVKE